MKRIVCAAIRHRRFHLLIVGPRHFDITMRYAIDRSDEGDEWYDAEQGFIDQNGNYLNRTDAWQVAKDAEQIIRRVGGDNANGGTLYSENLY